MSAPRGRELLWVVPKWPLPAQDGARVATRCLIEGLIRRGHVIDLVAFGGPPGSPRGSGPPPEALDPARVLGVRRVFRIGGAGWRANSGRGARGLAGQLALLQSFVLKPWLPVTFRDFATRSASRAVSGVLEHGYSGPGAGWFAVVYDGLHPAIHSSRLGLYRPSARAPRRVLYRAHNFESDIWRRKAERTRSFALRAFLRYQASRVLAFERSLVGASAGVAPVSPEDWSALSALCPAPRGRVVPIGYDFREPAPAWAGQPVLEEGGLEGRRGTGSGGALPLLFVGRLDWAPNREGLAWFLDQVWDPARRRQPALRLSVVGSGDGSWLESRLLASGGKETGVEFLGRVEDLEAVYRRSLLSIVPVFYGSGTRVKVIESCRYGRACLSTALGVEGTGLVPGESYLRAETEEEWIEALAALDPGRALGVAARARERMRETFDLDHAAAEFERLLDEVE